MESKEREAKEVADPGYCHGLTAHLEDLLISKVVEGFAGIFGLRRFCWGLGFLRSIERGPPAKAEFQARGRTSALADGLLASSRYSRRPRV